MKSQIKFRFFNTFVCLTACLGLISISTGCSSLALQSQQIMPPPANGAAITGKYEVQITPMFGKSGEFEGDIDGPITIQTVLERSGATKKFRSMDIVILRRLEKTGGTIRLPVDYQTLSKSVVPEQDYAIHPNDLISIKASSSNPLDKVMESLAPALGPALGR